MLIEEQYRIVCLISKIVLHRTIQKVHLSQENSICPTMKLLPILSMQPCAQREKNLKIRWPFSSATMRTGARAELNARGSSAGRALPISDSATGWTRRAG